MKKLIVLFAVLSIALAGCQKAEPSQATPITSAEEAFTGGNYSDEMKIPYSVDLQEWGADSVEREGDHENSLYFNTLDFYNMESTDTLTILTNFKTYQQTSEWSCGVASALMVLNYYDKLGDYDEKTLAEIRSNGLNEEAFVKHRKRHLRRLNEDIKTEESSATGRKIGHLILKLK